MIAMISKSYRKNKSVFWIPIAIVMVLSVVLFSGNVFSFGDSVRTITFDNGEKPISWNINEPNVVSPDLSTKSTESNISFQLDLEDDYDKYTGNPDEVPVPFKITSSYNNTDIASGNITISKVMVNDEGTLFEGKYTVNIGIPTSEDGVLKVNLEFFQDSWVKEQKLTTFTIVKDSKSPIIHIEVEEGVTETGESNYRLIDPNELFDNKDVPVRIRVNEQNFDSENANFLITRDNETIQKELEWKQIGANVFELDQFTLKDVGTYSILVTVKDKYGLHETTESISFDIFKEGPKLKSIVSGTYKEDVTILVNSDLKIDSAAVTGTIDTNEVDETTIKFDVKGKNATLNISNDGSYVLNIAVTDKRGNKLESTLEFTIDKTPPSVSFDIADNSNFNYDQEVTITLKDRSLDLVEEKTYFTVTKNGKSYNREIEPFAKINESTATTKHLFSDEGIYVIKVTSTDSIGNPTTVEELTFTIDKSNPILGISGVEDKGHYQKVNLLISIEDMTLGLEDAFTKIIVTRDGSEVTNINTKNPWTIIEVLPWIFRGEILLSYEMEGDYNVTIESTDLAGNNTSQATSFIIDNKEPQVYVKKQTEVNGDIIWKDVNDKEIFSGPQKLEISVNDDYLKSAEIVINQNGEEHVTYNPEINGNVATVQHEFADDGVYDIIVTSSDKAGNKNDEYKLTVIIDKDEKPSFEIIGVEDGQHYSDSEKEVTFKVTDFSFNPLKTKLTIKRVNGSENETIEVKPEDWSIVDQILWLLHGKFVYNFNKEGTYTITLESKDYSDNTNSKTISFTLDRISPVIEFITDIKEGSFIQKGQQIGIKVNEQNYKTNKVDVIVTKDGEDYKDIGQWNNEVEGYVLKHTFNKDGKYKIVVNAKDKALNVAQTKTLEFTVDNIDPEIVIDGIVDGNYYSNSQTATITIKELNFNKNKVSVDINGSQYKIDKWIKSGDNVFSYDIPFNNERDYVLTIHLEDDATNSAEKKIKFTIDKNPPVTKINGVDHMTNYKSDRKVEFIASDTNLAETSLHVTKNGKPIDVGSLTKTGSTASLTYTFTEEGSYVLYFSATDKSGNKTTHEEIAFIIDKTNPVVKIDGVDHQSFNPTGKRVTVSVDELNFGTNYVVLSVTKDGKVFNIGTWQNNNKLSSLGYNFNDDGLYTIGISAEDKAGNGPIAANKTFTIDTTKPTIEITGVENAAHYNVDKPVNVAIRDVNLDVNRITVTRNGRGYNPGGFAVANQTARLSHNFSQEGDYVINVEAIDKAGNQYSDQIAFTIDKTAPVITPKFKGQSRVIKDGEYINEVFTPEFALDQANDTIVSVTMNGSNVTGRIPTASLEMTYKFSVLARDKAGNESTIDISFILDTTKPTLNINGVIDGFFNKNQMPNVTYSDRYLDTSRTRVTLNGRPYVNGLQLSDEGDYILKAEIYDLANNVSSRTIVFTIDKTAPIIKFKEAISEKYFKESLLPELLIEDLNAYDIISQTLNGQPYNLGDPIEDEGKHVLFFEVKDKAGNIQQLSVEFIIDKTPPKVNFDGVKKNETYRDPVSFSISLDNPSDDLKSVMINGELFNGDVKEVNGSKVITVTLSDINKYKVEVLATDEAGNENNEVMEFEIVEKSVLVKFYENKTLFAGTMVGLVGAAATGAVAIRRVIIRRRDAKDM